MTQKGSKMSFWFTPCDTFEWHSDIWSKKRKPSRSRTRWLYQIKTMVKCSVAELYNLVEDHHRWRVIVAIMSCQKWPTNPYKTYIFWTTVVKGCMYMFNVVDTAFNYWRALIICLFLQESSKVKESSLHEIWNADTAFLLGGAIVTWHFYQLSFWGT